MNALLGYMIADQDFYEPLETAPGRGAVYRPSRVPEAWRGADAGVWTNWHRDGLPVPAEGWKVHVSARFERLRQVLDVAADICFDEDVSFKHLSCRTFYEWTHYKHGSRAQGGKFIAAYPSDVEAARRLMERLAAALKDEEGPFILSDRRFPGSRVVHYRYGGFARIERSKADGTREFLVRDGNGELVPDRRGTSFHLPDGVLDPFAAARDGRTGAPAAKTADTAKAADDASEHVFGGFAFEKAIRHSNSGGAYQARERSTGRKVFVKEGRAHIAFTGKLDSRDMLRGERDTLRALHELAPGVAPEPIAYFSKWEHDFLVTEFVPGITLSKWVVRNCPLIQPAASAEDFAAYYARCEKLISGIERALERLHSCGYLFVDVSYGNVLVDEDDEVRLIDFESAHRLGGEFVPIGTPDYTPPPALVGEDLFVYDTYGLAALAQLMLAPFHQVAQRNPDALAHLHEEMTQLAPVPPALWKRATAFSAQSANPVLPSPERIAEAPLVHLADLRDRVGDALLAMADAGHPVRMFPTVPKGHQSNTLCVAYGAAGVLHALHQAGRELPDAVLERLRREALGQADEMVPGLHVGTAGIARVLADLGRLDEARTLLDAADRHPLTARNATLFGGAAGVALSHLALHRSTGDEHHLRRAAALADALPADAELVDQLGPDDATGLLHGRTGIALMLHQLAAATGESAYLERGLRLLHAELDRECDPDGPGMAFPVSTTDIRVMPYLYCGSAGVVHVATRYLQSHEDERLAAAMPRLLTQLQVPFTVMPSLFPGAAGLGFALADHAMLTGDQAVRAAAVRMGRRLFKYAIPHPTGVRYPGDQLQRLSADLWSGSAGVLLFLTHLLDPRPDRLFTVDFPVDAQAAGRTAATRQ